MTKLERIHVKKLSEYIYATLEPVHSHRLIKGTGPLILNQSEGLNSRATQN